jgi:DNA-binding transcriptional LysR family regulator
MELGRFLNDRLDWNLLRTWLVIGQERSISRAAARLHLTQPAVSQALRRLEEQLGAALVQRRGPRFEITALGEEILRIAGDINGNVSRLAAALEQPADQVVGKVRLLSISRIQSGFYDDVLADFHRAHPGVELDIEVMRSADVLSSLQQKTATLGLALCRQPSPRLDSAPSCASATSSSAAATMASMVAATCAWPTCRARITSPSPATRSAKCSRR